MNGGRAEKRVPMTRLRAKVAERLLQATQTTAMLTTFNEVNMEAVMELRNKYMDAFEKQHEGTRLGFMSFCMRQCRSSETFSGCERLPWMVMTLSTMATRILVLLFHRPRGLVVPVLRDADTLSFADIEASIRDFGLKARDGKLSIEEMSGGTFTISNGGVLAQCCFHADS